MSLLYVASLGSGLLLLDLGLRLLALIYVPPNRRPTAAMAWLLAIFFIPVLGGLLFLLIGNPKLPRHRLHKQEEMDDVIAEHAAQSPEPDTSQWPEWVAGVVRMNEEHTAMPLLADNRGSLIGDYAESLDAMAQEIAGARTYVHVEFYILSLDESTSPFFDALEAAVERGVTVRVLLDHWASSHCRDYKATIARLDAMGAQWHLMLPVQPLKGRYQRLDLRNHRKLLVVDGRTAFIGSQNLIDRTYNKKGNISRGLKWQDLMTRIEGPVVASVDLVFATDWYMESGERLPATDPPSVTATTPAGELLECQLVPSGPGYPVENNLQLFLSLLYAARERVAVTSPYFVPEESMLRGIMAAIARGVTVELFVSEIGDQALVWHAQRSYYASLLDAGMRIYQYPAPYILHAKHFSIDDDVAVIGSSNMDMRSFGLNCEVSLMVRSRHYVEQMRRVEDEYRSISTELTAQQWAMEPTRRTVVDGLARLTSALQ
ncbi:cardiolipin synthase [Janibacter cremeus]|uniref:Cardiolipin synthase n=1 Tax=Janibacter cremeus TaxID=1285192 RepID=A0A852VQF4_9MICO|nr:cardiolipin synthase [Janibacter cremeus]NYF99267.1 cardiolipin synthase [Janibacter cremeus]